MDSDAATAGAAQSADHMGSPRAGEGLERSIEATAKLRDLDPKPQYTIVGRTHPVVARNQGLAYRGAWRAW